LDYEKTTLHSIDPERVRQLLIQRRHWPEGKPAHIEMVEVSPSFCCFEWEAGREGFDVGEPLDLHFLLDDCRLSKRASILSVDRCEFLDEGYEHQPWLVYCARFDGKIDGPDFERIAGTPRVCRSFYRISGLLVDSMLRCRQTE
jgi:hypothetical protein